MVSVKDLYLYIEVAYQHLPPPSLKSLGFLAAYDAETSLGGEGQLGCGKFRGPSYGKKARSHVSLTGDNKRLSSRGRSLELLTRFVPLVFVQCGPKR